MSVYVCVSWLALGQIARYFIVYIFEIVHEERANTYFL